MKKIKYLFLIMLCLLTLTACTKKESKPSSTPIFFEVTKENSNNKIYLLGSIHAADENLYPLPTTIENAYKKSDYLAVEFDMIEYVQNIGAQIEDMQKLTYNDGTTIKDYIDEEKYNKMKEILEDANMYSSLYDVYKPIMWMTLIENASITKSDLNAEYGIDMHFLNNAKEDNKKILELESAELQYNVLLSFSDELVDNLLDDAINGFDESVNGLKDLYAKYKDGNREELEKLIFEESENELEEEYNNALVTKRNIGMYEKLDKEFKNNNNIFCTVGLAHILGQDGLVNLFIQNGYTVKEVK